mmetsp:Transcript_7468/g.17325  ORF Transcript_7468/g.17325 Transcript_7468/m.17325 type:complete len:202 (-) Transcript_7468:39-644(-)
MRVGRRRGRREGPRGNRAVVQAPLELSARTLHAGPLVPHIVQGTRRVCPLTTFPERSRLEPLLCATDRGALRATLPRNVRRPIEPAVDAILFVVPHVLRVVRVRRDFRARRVGGEECEAWISHVRVASQRRGGGERQEIRGVERLVHGGNGFKQRHGTLGVCHGSLSTWFNEMRRTAHRPAGERSGRLEPRQRRACRSSRS